MDYEVQRQHLERCLESYQQGKIQDAQILIDALEVFKNEIVQTDSQYYSLYQSLITEAKNLTDNKIQTIKNNGQHKVRILVKLSVILLGLVVFQKIIINPIRYQICEYQNVQPRTYEEKNKCETI
jgi:hypothetical protein